MGGHRKKRRKPQLPEGPTTSSAASPTITITYVNAAAPTPTPEVTKRDTIKREIIVATLSIIVGIVLATFVGEPIRMVVSPFLARYLKSRDELKTSAPTAQNVILADGDALPDRSEFRVNAIVRNVSDRIAHGARVSVEPPFPDIELELLGASTDPEGWQHLANVRDTRSKNDPHVHIIDIDQLNPDHTLILHFLARSPRYRPNLALKVKAGAADFKEELQPMNRLLPNEEDRTKPSATTKTASTLTEDWSDQLSVQTGTRQLLAKVENGSTTRRFATNGNVGIGATVPRAVLGSARDVAMGSSGSYAITLHVADASKSSSGTPGAFALANIAPHAAISAPQIVSWMPSGGATSYEVYSYDTQGNLSSAQFTKTWRLRNSGTSAWNNYGAVFVSGTNLDSNGVTSITIPNTAAGNTVETGGITGAPQIVVTWTPSIVATSYDLYRNGSFYAQGNPAKTTSLANTGSNLVTGTTYTYRVQVRNANGTRDSDALQATASDRLGEGMQFVADVTIPEDTRLNPVAQFTKTWHLRNTGTTTWANHKVVFVGSTPFAASAALSATPTITSVSPNSVRGSGTSQTFTISGANFVSGATVIVTWNGHSALARTSEIFVSRTALHGSAILSPLLADWMVSVVNPDGEVHTLRGLELTPNTRSITTHGVHLHFAVLRPVNDKSGKVLRATPRGADAWTMRVGKPEGEIAEYTFDAMGHSARVTRYPSRTWSLHNTGFHTLPTGPLLRTVSAPDRQPLRLRVLDNGGADLAVSSKVVENKGQQQGDWLSSSQRLRVAVLNHGGARLSVTSRPSILLRPPHSSLSRASVGYRKKVL